MAERTSRGSLRTTAAGALASLGAAAIVVGCGSDTFEQGPESMMPTISPGAEVTIDKEKTPVIGDVVLYSPPADSFGACPDQLEGGVCVVEPTAQDAETQFLHRVVGGADDLLQIVDGSVVINDTPESGYETVPCTGAAGVTCDSPPFRVPLGHVFVIGDNRAESTDSRSFGFVPEDWIVGVATDAEGEPLGPPADAEEVRERDGELLDQMVGELNRLFVLTEEKVVELDEQLAEITGRDAAAAVLTSQARDLEADGHLQAGATERLAAGMSE